MVYYRCFFAGMTDIDDRRRLLTRALSDSAFGDIALTVGEDGFLLRREGQVARVTVESLAAVVSDLGATPSSLSWTAAITPGDDCSQGSMYLAWEALNYLVMCGGEAVWMHERTYGRAAIAKHAPVRPFTFPDASEGFVLTAEEFSAFAES